MIQSMKLTVSGGLLLVAVGLLGSLIPLAALLYCLVFPPIYSGTVPVSEISQYGGFTFSTPVPDALLSPWLVYRNDAGAGQNRASNLKLSEDGKSLGPAHSMHVDISNQGLGRFSHWGATLLFSASDNSDPRTNGRVYLVQMGASPSYWLIGLALILPVGALEFARRLTFFRKPAWAERIFSIHRTFFAGAVRDEVFTLGVSIVALLVFDPVDALLLSSGDHSDLVRLAAIALIVLAGWSMKSAALPRPFMWACRAFTCTLAAYAFLRNFPIDFVVNLKNPIEFHHLMIGPIAGLVAAALAWRRPVFGVYVACVGFWYREAIERHYGLILGHGEEKSMAATLIMMLLLGLSVHWTIRGRRYLGAKLGRVPLFVADNDQLKRAFNNIVLLAVALQFSNYFYSAIQKWNLDGGAGDWLLSNTTYFLLSSADVLGVLPIGDWTTLKELIFEHWVDFNIVSNGITWFSQFLSIAALWFKPMLAPVILILDMWHVSVAVLTGIVFWIWIILNVVLAACVARIRSRPSMALRLLMTLFLLNAPAGFSIFMAGWYDTPAVNQLKIKAVMADGTQLAVPPEAFRFYSYNFVMGSILDRKQTAQSFFPTHGFGTTYISRDRVIAEQCRLPMTQEVRLPAIDPAALRILGAVHKDAARGTSRWRMFLYPHHLFAGAGLSNYLGADFTQIVGYRFELAAICAVVEHGQYHLDTLRSATSFVPLEAILQ